MDEEHSQEIQEAYHGLKQRKEIQEVNDWLKQISGEDFEPTMKILGQIMHATPSLKLDSNHIYQNQAVNPIITDPNDPFLS